MSQASPDNVTAFVAKVTTHVEAVNPTLAARWMLCNTCNRKIRFPTVDKYSYAMSSGVWTVSNDDICFDPEGNLLNGQHRLLAIIQSGTTQIMTVKRNVPRSAMKHMDRGTSRSYADQLRFAGEMNVNVLGAILKQAVLIDTGRIYRDTHQQTVGDAEMDDYLEAEPGIRMSAAVASHFYSQIFAPPTTIGVAHWMIAGTNSHGVADHYIEQLAKRTGEAEGSAVLAVDKRLREIQRNHQQFPVRNYIYLLIKGWNYYAKDRPVAKLQMAPGHGAKFQLPLAAEWDRT